MNMSTTPLKSLFVSLKPPPFQRSTLYSFSFIMNYS
ncbi:hypothetical protein BVRB_7g164960 [Beta vulgaris subsp. vulgaris]|uniref:Uncharacterized protein n=1 Tax=Beta vulgaris subsp. vulgaris TaxID=3555 RepID=A0A0J8C0S5_BETVV|nr:hypothetical protein BVRB_7g164960 [Beta vulgaris subsp. vulgaris]